MALECGSKVDTVLILLPNVSRDFGPWIEGYGDPILRAENFFYGRCRRLFILFKFIAGVVRTKALFSWKLMA